MTTDRPTSNRLPLLATLGASALLMVVVLTFTLVRCGLFNYTLDDPYIHLALARQIAQGHYGLQAGEAAAPSSSILWPFLLVPFAPTPLFELAPLLLNVAFALLAAAALVACFAEAFREAPDAPRRVAAWSIATLLASNGVAIAFTGMEHSLQMWLTVLIALGLIRVYRDAPTPPSLPVALALAPLVRYENLALTAAAAAFLFSVGRRRAALAAVVPVVGIVAFSLFLKGQGLGLLPSSVVAKSPGLARLAGLLPPGAGQGSLLDGLMSKLRTPLNYGFILFIPAVLAASFPRAGGRRARGLWGVVAFALLAHLLVGEIGWFQRYEMYLYAFGTAMAVFMHREFGALRLPRAPVLRGLVVGGFFLVFGVQSIRALVMSPGWAWSVFAQQRQMMRFARDFNRGGVAINDLGEVAFGSGRSVVDLWGLASIDALRARMVSDRRYDWAGPIIDARRIGLLMIYPTWIFPQPSSWRLVGVLRRRHVFGVAGDEVSFYATPWSDLGEVREQARRFARSLPKGASFELAP